MPVLYYVELNGNLFLALWLYLAVVRVKGVKKMEFVEPIRDKRKIELVKVILKENGFRNYMLFLMGINSGLRISDY